MTIHTTGLIDDVTIDSDEDGFTLRVEGDFLSVFEEYIADVDSAGVTLRLHQNEAIQLAAQVRKHIQPWVDTMEYERAAYNRATPEERARVLGGGISHPSYATPGLVALYPEGCDEQTHELERRERLLEGADLMNKARKENP